MIVSFRYSNVSNNRLQCLFESNEVGQSLTFPIFFLKQSICFDKIFVTGIFNVTLLVTNGYGLSRIESYLYRLSGTGQSYNFESYPGNQNHLQFTVHVSYFCSKYSFIDDFTSNRKCIRWKSLDFTWTIFQCQSWASAHC